VNLLLFYGTPLPSVNSNSSQGGDSSQSSTSLEAKNGIENIGLAVFKDGKLIGKLSAIETLCHLLVTNELDSCNISIPDPKDENKEIDLYLTVDSPTKIKVNIINGTPYTTVDINVNTRISSIDDLFEDMNQERINQIKSATENYLNTQVSNYLYKTAKEFNSDIAGTGKYTLKHFKTSSDFSDYNWKKKYENSFFKVNTTTTIKSGFLLTGA